MGSKGENNWVYRNLRSKYYDNNLGVLGLDYYRQDSQGEDDFTRRQVWFYTYGDEEIYEEFADELEDLFESVVIGSDISWDLITLVPTHFEEQINPNMERLVKTLGKAHDIDYRPLLRRGDTIHETSMIRSFRQRLINIEDSIDLTEDIEGQNVILVDNISVTGASMLHAANILYENGAENVLGVCLGLSYDRRENDIRGVGEFSLDELRSESKNPTTVESLGK